MTVNTYTAYGQLSSTKTYDALGNITSVKPATYVSLTQCTPVANAENVTYSYNNHNLLESITTDSTKYTFVYDSFGNTEKTSVGNRDLATYEYYPNNGKLKKITYGNGFSEKIYLR